jgi:uncharacterized protein HemX
MRKNHGWAAFWQKKQYIIAGTLVILAAVGMTVLYSRGQEQERKQLEQEIAAEMDTENQNVAMEEETEADQVASILKPQTQSTETAEVEKESDIIWKICHNFDRLSSIFFLCQLINIYF